MDRPRPEPASDVGQGKRLSPGAELVPGFHQRLHGLSEQGRLCRPANAAAGLPPAPEISVRHGSYAWCQEPTFGSRPKAQFDPGGLFNFASVDLAANNGDVNFTFTGFLGGIQ